MRSSALDFVEQYLRQLSPLHSVTVWQTKYVRPDSERKFFQRPDPRMVAILANCPFCYRFYLVVFRLDGFGGFCWGQQKTRPCTKRI